MIIMHLKLTLLDPALGTSASSLNTLKDYIWNDETPEEGKAQEEENLENTLSEYPEEKTPPMTVFPRDKDGNPIYYDYQVRGMLKDGIGMLRKIKDTESARVKAYKKQVDGLIFVTPREIPIWLNGDLRIDTRPLRASTPQGERVALSSSEMVPAGSFFKFDIQCMDEKDVLLVEEVLDYGRFHGIGQWRNSGKGRFTWERTAPDEDVDWRKIK